MRTVLDHVFGHITGHITVAALLLLGSMASGCNQTTAAVPSSQSTRTALEGPPRVAANDPPVGQKLALTPAAWREKLTPGQFRILREQGTERAFSGRYWEHKGDGVYRCAACKAPLFDSRAKFKSGTGWPSFWTPIQDGRVEVRVDRAHGMIRKEIVCARCGGHLGHVFADGPKPTGDRYCVNSVSLDFSPAK